MTTGGEALYVLDDASPVKKVPKRAKATGKEVNGVLFLEEFLKEMAAVALAHTEHSAVDPSRAGGRGAR
jgi:hypothetical protein